MRFGVCGTAHWAESIHLPALQRAPGVELVAVHGRNRARLEALSGRFGIEGHADFAAMLEQVDAVTFAVPPDVQPALALQAARAGKHIMLEKPPAKTTAEASALAAAIVQGGLRANCFLTRRYIPQVVEFADHGRSLGATTGAAIISSGALLPGSPYACSPWRQGEHATLWDLGPHALAPLVVLFGAIAAVRAEEGAGIVRAWLTHAGGGTSFMQLNQRDPSGRFNETYRFTAAGTEHELQGANYDRLDAFGRAITDLTAGGNPDQRWAGARVALDMVPVLVAVQQSIVTGGVPLTL